MHDMNQTNKTYFIYFMAAMLLLTSHAALADELGNGLCDVVQIFTGKVMFSITMLATIGAGLAVLFGAELSEFIKKVASIIAIVGIIMILGQLLTKAFPKLVGC